MKQKSVLTFKTTLLTTETTCITHLSSSKIPYKTRRLSAPVEVHPNLAGFYQYSYVQESKDTRFKMGGAKNLYNGWEYYH